MIETISLVIFDCDGVLVDSESLSNKLMAEMLGEHGFDISSEQAHRTFEGTSMKFIKAYFFEQTGRHLPENFEKSFRKRSNELFSRELQPIPGIRNFIESLSIPYVVASNGPREKIEPNLKITGLDVLFGTRIFSAYDIKKWKPKPDLYLHAASTMQIPPERCLVIEDSVSGITAAKAAQMTAFGYSKNLEKRNRLHAAGADNCFEDFYCLKI